MGGPYPTLATMGSVVSWREAMQSALYGETGFFTRHAPADHFRTSVTASPLFASAIARLVGLVDEALDRPDRFDLVDVGAGRGELLLGLAAALPEELRARTSLVAVERARRPDGLPEWIDWHAAPPERITGLLVATEWLDNVPLDVAEVDGTGEPRLVLVDADTGAERPYGAVSGRDAAWLDRWWPPAESGTRAEIGHSRDEAWAAAVAAVERGLALAVDYGHLAGARPAAGTLTGYRDGRQVAPVPDGGCDLTAHVAMDAVAAAGERAAGAPSRRLEQRAALRALGVTGARPPLELAARDPAGYVRALASATQAAELTDPSGLGAHWWLLQPVGIAIRLG